MRRHTGQRSRHPAAFARERALTSPAHRRDSAVADSIVRRATIRTVRARALGALRSQLMLGWLNNAGAVRWPSPVEPAEGAAGWPQNLAVLFAQAGQRTLLIDADLRQPANIACSTWITRSACRPVLTGRANGRDVALPDSYVAGTAGAAGGRCGSQSQEC